MKKLLKAIVWILAALVVIFIGGGYLLPNEVTVQRQTVINAPQEKVFALVDGYKRFNEWSPWAELDPNTKYTFEGPESGVGAKMSWASNDPNVGSGSQTITEHVPNSHVAADLDFGAMGKSRAYWDLKPEGVGTSATWGFKMKLDGMMDRWFGLLMERFIGPDYDKGLAKVKALAEKEAAGG
jgi:uncharacterized protein YndB with AHSA1/START domain